MGCPSISVSFRPQPKLEEPSFASDTTQTLEGQPIYRTSS